MKKPCPCCKTVVDGTINGIYWGTGEPQTHFKPLAVSLRCECGTSRAIAWAAATEEQRNEAIAQHNLRFLPEDDLPAPA